VPDMVGIRNVSVSMSASSLKSESVLTRRFGEQLDAFSILTAHVKQFCLEHSKTLCVALRKHPESAPQEFEWEHGLVS